MSLNSGEINMFLNVDLDFIIAETRGFSWKSGGMCTWKKREAMHEVNSYLLGELQEAECSAHDIVESMPEPSLHCPVQAPVLWLSSKYSEFGNSTVKSYC